MLNCGFGLFFDVWPWVFRGFSLGDFGIERHLSLIWRSWCHAHDVRCCVRFFFFRREGLGAQSVLCACCGFP